MKKLLFLFVLMGLLFGLGAAPALAVPTADLTALARYFPVDAPAFAALRTDAGYIETLDGLLARIVAKLPPGVVPAFRLPTLLDLAAQQAGVGDFATGIRPWLGGTAAFGLVSAESVGDFDQEVLIAASITDRAKAEAFWKSLLDRSGGDYTVEQGDSFTFYAIEPDSPERGGLLFTDDVLLLGNTNVKGLLLGRDAKLAQNSTFTETLALLPETDYNLVIYLDTAALAGVSAPPDEKRLASMLGQQAVGLTILDNRSLVADVVANTGDLSQLQGMGITLAGTGAVDPAFAANIPADASLVLHAANPKALYDALLQSARLNTSEADLNRQLDQLRFAVRGATGLKWEEDILNWMTGDYALFVRLDIPVILAAIRAGIEASFSGETNNPFRLETLPFDFGIVVEATDPDKAKALAAALSDSLPTLLKDSPDTTVSQETINGVNVTVLSGRLEMNTDSRPPIDILIGANENIFLIATRRAAEPILKGEPGLDTAPAFAEASRYLLPDATSVWYTDASGGGGSIIVVGLAMLGPTIGDVFENIVDELSTPTPEEIQRREAERQRQQAEAERMIALFEALPTLLSSSSISTSYTEGGDALIRFVLTLAE